MKLLCTVFASFCILSGTESLLIAQKENHDVEHNLYHDLGHDANSHNMYHERSHDDAQVDETNDDGDQG